MHPKELQQCLTPHSLECCKARPAQEEVADQRGADVRESLQNLRKVALQKRSQPVAEPRPVADHSAAMLDEQAQGARLLRVGLPNAQPLAVRQEQLGEVGRVGRVVLMP